MRVRFSVWLVSGYAHIFILLSVVIVTLPPLTGVGKNLMFEYNMSVIMRTTVS